jgi:hypothetical protein
MNSSATEQPRANAFVEICGWIVGGGVVMMVLFPLAIPILVLTAVFTAPLAILGVLAALPLGLIAAVVLAIRATWRSRAGRGRHVHPARTELRRPLA